MKILFLFSVLFISGFLAAQKNPLSAYGWQWASVRYDAANTAAKAPYLSKTEKELIYVLNLARMDPALFAATVLKNDGHFKAFLLDTASTYYRSLLQLMDTLKSLPLLYPDSAMFVTADCHAVTSGKVGYVGHERQDKRCSVVFDAECCDYGSDDPVEIIVHLLIDEDVPSLGHRNICLSGYAHGIGVALRPHSAYGNTTVLDFAYIF